jgi:hypothetical protein
MLRADILDVPSGCDEFASVISTVEPNRLASATRTKDMAPFAGQPRPPVAV